MRPRVHVNFAMTLDGYIGGRHGAPLRVSNEEDLRRVHALRARVDAILVGVGTVLADNPKLTVKWDLLGRRPGRNPLRVVLDSRLRTPASAHVASDAASSVFFAGPRAPARPSWDVERVPTRDGALDLGVVLERLGRRKVRTLMVEGGSRTLTSFFRGDWVDEATIFVSPRALGEPRGRPAFAEPVHLAKGLRLASVRRLGDGALYRWVRPGA